MAARPECDFGLPPPSFPARIVLAGATTDRDDDDDLFVVVARILP